MTRAGAITDAELAAEDRLLKPDQAATILGIGLRSVWRLANGDTPPLEPVRLRMPGARRPVTRFRLSDVRRVRDQGVDRRP